MSLMAPGEPPHSCPSFNRAIEYIEEARGINSDLREWGSWWQERAGEIESEKDAEIGQRDNEIDQLKRRVSELEAENSYLLDELDAYRREVGV